MREQLELSNKACTHTPIQATTTFNLRLISVSVSRNAERKEAMRELKHE